MRNFDLGGTRDGYRRALDELADNHPKVVVMDADLAESTFTRHFANKAPERFFEMGIAENDMCATAAGLAFAGFKPIFSSYAMFLAGRSWDQIRNSIAYGDADVVVAAAHGGITVGKDGPTHQSMEDLSNMLVIPNMSVAVPCDEEQTYRICMYAATQHVGPFYFRMCREKSSNITGPETPFEFGKALLLEAGADLTFIACGVILDRVLQAVDMLREKGLSCRVLNMHTLKPLDTEAIDAAVADTGCVVTVEEHSRYGGLGSLVAVHLARHHCGRASFDMVAIEDLYLESGPHYDMLDLAGFTADNIADRAFRAFQRKPK